MVMLINTGNYFKLLKHQWSIQVNERCGLRKITRSSKVPNYEILGAQHLSLYEKSKFFQLPRDKIQSPVAPRCQVLELSPGFIFVQPATTSGKFFLCVTMHNLEQARQCHLVLLYSQHNAGFVLSLPLKELTIYKSGKILYSKYQSIHNYTCNLVNHWCIFSL